MRRAGLVVLAVLVTLGPGRAPVPAPAAAAAYDRARGTGGFGPVRFSFTATAHTRTGTRATGRFRRSWTVLGAPPGAALTGSVSCLVVDGDRATFGGTLDAASLRPGGLGAFVMSVRDADGDGGADEASWGVLLSSADLRRACTAHDRLTTPLWTGGIDVRDATPGAIAGPQRQRTACWDAERRPVRPNRGARGGCVEIERSWPARPAGTGPAP